MDDEQLIEFVRNVEELYNQEHKDYFDGARKNRKWNEIGVKLNQPGIACKQRWESLRGQLRKHLKARETSTGMAAKKIRKWKLEDEMAFLIPFLKDKARVSSLGGTAEDDDVDPDDPEPQEVGAGSQRWDDGASQDGAPQGQDVRASQDDAPQVQDVSASQDGASQRKSVGASQRRAPKKHRKNANSASATLMNYLIRQKECEPAGISAPETQRDSVDLFFDSIKATVRTFSPADFYDVKTKIFNTVSQIEQKYLMPQENVVHNTFRQVYSFNDNSNYGNYSAYTSNVSSHSSTADTPVTVPTPLSSLASYVEDFSPGENT
ncbi:hypothetical protein M8J76_002128 [Diaphorina citri]|nr:hypothetical protein M8J75_010275 [Diaphorina citri]KAI5713610.1 hypothetical protein M8J76_002128 [Diaphorina citri]